MFINWFLFSLVFWSNKYFVQEKERERERERGRGQRERERERERERVSVSLENFLFCWSPEKCFPKFSKFGTETYKPS